jgi:predicted nucleic acid-binding protein
VLILIDTSVWSLALRRQERDLNPEEKRIGGELRHLIEEGRAQLIGPVRQELLSGIREAAQYERLRQHLGGFPDVPLETTDFEHAARLGNQCRAGGVAGSLVDFLICAIAIHRNWPIFTTDHDFRGYAKILPIALHAPRK